jgi:hypothetical protein
LCASATLIRSKHQMLSCNKKSVDVHKSKTVYQPHRERGSGLQENSHTYLLLSDIDIPYSPVCENFYTWFVRRKVEVCLQALWYHESRTLGHQLSTRRYVAGRDGPHNLACRGVFLGKVPRRIYSFENNFFSSNLCPLRRDTRGERDVGYGLIFFVCVVFFRLRTLWTEYSGCQEGYGWHNETGTRQIANTGTR